MRIFVLFISLFSTSFVFAQTGVVRKVKGKSAIIRFDERPNFRKGERVTLGDGYTSSGGSNSRKYSLSLSFDMGSTTISAGGAESEEDTLSINSFLTLNKGTFEFGGGLVYDSEDNDGTELTTYSFLGSGEYNFIPNRPGKKFIPAVQGLVGISNIDATGGVSGNGLTLGLNGRLKIFPWNDSFAIVLAMGLRTADVDVGGGVSYDVDVFSTTAGFQGYF